MEIYDTKYTPLHIASAYGHVDICKLLLENKQTKSRKESSKLADIHYDLNTTPLHLAAMYGHSNVCEYLLNNVGESMTGPERTSPLHLAAYEGASDICKLLLDAGADPNATDHFGNTPMHLATLDDYQGSAIGVCNVLCEYGAISSIFLKNKNGDSPISCLDEKFHGPLITYLRNMYRQWKYEQYMEAVSVANKKSMECILLYGIYESNYNKLALKQPASMVVNQTQPNSEKTPELGSDVVSETTKFPKINFIRRFINYFL